MNAAIPTANFASFRLWCCWRFYGAPIACYRLGVEVVIGFPLNDGKTKNKMEKIVEFLLDMCTMITSLFISQNGVNELGERMELYKPRSCLL